MFTQRPLPGFLWIVELAEHLNVRIDRHVRNWPDFDKAMIGDQLIRAVDSIGLNLSEGYARAHLKKRLHFFSIAHGSLEEALFAIRRARDRNLIQRIEAAAIANLLLKLSKAINEFEIAIKSPILKKYKAG